MLVSLEHYFHDALRSVLPADVEVMTGPSLGPSGAAVTQLVEVSAPSLTLALPPEEDVTAGREAAFHAQVHRWRANGKQVDFTLPASARGRIAEVESPPGRPLRRGDDYELEEGRKVRCYRPPARAEVAVVAWLRGEPAQGFLERRRCEIAFVTRAWGRGHGVADRLLSSALAAVQVASTGLGNLEELSAESGFRARLLRPAMTLRGLVRGAEPLHGTTFLRAQAEFLIRGELEQLVAVGEPEPTGLIREIRGEVEQLDEEGEAGKEDLRPRTGARR